MSGEDYDNPSNKCCGSCRHFCPYLYEFEDHDVETEYGECRRFPPKPVPAEEVGFPVVLKSCWCGEFDI